MDKGEIIKKIINRTGYPISALARRLNMSRTTLYNYLDRKDLDDNLINRIGSTINYSFHALLSETKARQLTEFRYRLAMLEEAYREVPDEWLDLIVRLIDLFVQTKVQEQREEALEKIIKELQRTTYK